MERIFRSAWLPRLVLAWFVAFVCVSVATPVFHPVHQQLVCSAGGAGKLVDVDSSGSGTVQHDIGMHCALCLPVAAGFPEPVSPDLHLPALRHVLRAPRPTQLASAEALTPLSRGPPAYS